MLDKLKLDEAHAEAVVQKGIDLGTHSDDMPDTKKGKIEAAHEILTFAIDAFVDDNVRPGVEGEDDDETASIEDAAAEIMELFEMAGITAVKKGKKYTGDLKFGKLPELEEEDDDDDGDEAAFDIEDIIEGYEELTAATRVKKIKALDLDPDEDEDYNTLVGIAEWEEAQDKPSSRVLAYIDELAPPEEGDEDEEEEDETADDVGDDEEAEEAEGEEEPYTKKELAKLDKDGLREIWDAWEMDEDAFPKRFTDAGKGRVIEALLEAQEANGDNGDDEAEEDEFSEEPWEGYDGLTDAKKIAGVKEFMEDEDEPLDEEQLAYIIGWEESADKPRRTLIKKLNALLEELGEEDEDEEEEEEEKPARRGRRGSKDKAKDDDEDDEDEAPKGGGKITITTEDLAALLSKGKITLTVK